MFLKEVYLHCDSCSVCFNTEEPNNTVNGLYKQAKATENIVEHGWKITKTKQLCPSCKPKINVYEN